MNDGKAAATVDRLRRMMIEAATRGRFVDVPWQWGWPRIPDDPPPYREPA